MNNVGLKRFGTQVVHQKNTFVYLRFYSNRLIFSIVYHGLLVKYFFITTSIFFFFLTLQRCIRIFLNPCNQSSKYYFGNILLQPKPYLMCSSRYTSFGRWFGWFQSSKWNLSVVYFNEYQFIIDLKFDKFIFKTWNWVWLFSFSRCQYFQK